MPKKKMPAALKQTTKKKPVEKDAIAKAKTPKKVAGRKRTVNTPPRKEIGKTAKQSAAKRGEKKEKMAGETHDGDIAPAGKHPADPIGSAIAEGLATVNPFPKTGGQ